MKLRISILLGLFSGFSVFGQAKYYQSTPGNVLTEATYNERKNLQLEKIKAVLKDVSLDENLKELRKSGDSIVYSYRWHFKSGNDDQPSGEAETFKNLIGKPFPLGNLKMLDGKPISLDDLKGKPTLLNFWYAACKPCIDEMPVLNVLKQNLVGRANFVSVTYESEKTAVKFFKKHPFDFTPIVDAKSLTDALKMASFPVNIFLDKNGNVVRIENGIPYELQEDRSMKLGNEKAFQAILEGLM